MKFIFNCVFTYYINEPYITQPYYSMFNVVLSTNKTITKHTFFYSNKNILKITICKLHYNLLKYPFIMINNMKSTQQKIIFEEKNEYGCIEVKC